MKKKKHLFWIIPLSILILLTIGFFIYTSIYYHAEEIAYESLKSNDKVEVIKKDEYYLFDSDEDDKAIIFYPGGKVETEAYAPLCMELAKQGVDVFLVDMPFHLAFFGTNRANDIIDNYEYSHYYIGGHSLGGAIACKYAYNNSNKIDGVILLAAYSVYKLPNDLNNILIYGSNDLVLNKEKYINNKINIPNYSEHIIEGGNHSGYAYYGNQKGDGESTITKEKQIEETVNIIINKIS